MRPNLIPTRKCPACGMPFRPRTRKAKWCSDACRQWAFRARKLGVDVEQDKERS